MRAAAVAALVALCACTHAVGHGLVWPPEDIPPPERGAYFTQVQAMADPAHTDPWVGTDLPALPVEAIDKAARRS